MLSKKYRYPITPLANPKAMVCGENYRFTVLTSRLLRIEYSETGTFEDRATQTVLNRQFEVPEFTVKDEEGLLTISTDHLELTYTKQPFAPNSLQVRYRGANAGANAGNLSNTWCYGVDYPDNLRGTARTLDCINGACPLEPGLMSRGSVTTLDDSHTLLLREDGWVEPRKNQGIDQYLFCYGDVKKNFDYLGCLGDFYRLTGKTPMLPRFALGNWWSRYHAYTQEEYTELVHRFAKEEIPFSVAVIDMDWHHVQIDSKYGTGWTGYSWNKELFPDPAAFLSFLHHAGMEPSLNLHPQEGVAGHEDAYPELAKAMGIDPATEETIPFEIENPKFLENYFSCLHHPLEEEGVRFWWMDWQQGNITKVAGLDPLWMLNHYHFADNEKNGQRGLIFSRYAGPGSHRYPTGFSGDTHMTWESLDFQPYFTATASNIGYGWWSHDIGGHMAGYRDEEMIARWVQFGVFSPINRLHSANSDFLGKEPWKYNRNAEYSMKKFLKLRHQLVPYLYTMNYRASEKGEPMVQPLYYAYPEGKAYEFPNEYLFGTQMLVSPITKPADQYTAMGSVKTYLPQGVWYDFFNHLRYRGGKTVTMFRDLEELPVLVKAGGIVPMMKELNGNHLDNPETMRIKVFAGDSNVFELYEDDGNTKEYLKGAFAVTKLELLWGENPVFTIHAPEGDRTVIPAKRSYEIQLVGIKNPKGLTVTEQGQEKAYTADYREGVLTITVEGVCETLAITARGAEPSENNTKERLYRVIERLEHMPNDDKCRMAWSIQDHDQPQRVLSDILQLGLDTQIIQAVSEILTAEDYKRVEK